MYQVLIVDDERMIRDLISQVLSMKGHQCDQASDGVEALEKTSKKKYDALIVDIVMPKMDGFTLLQKIHQKAPDLPVMIMTGFNRLSYLKQPIDEEVFRAGASDFVSKPFSTSEFSARFHRMMAAHEILLKLKAQQQEIERKSSEVIAALEKESMEKIANLKKEYGEAGTSGLPPPEARTNSIDPDKIESIPTLDHGILQEAKDCSGNAEWVKTPDSDGQAEEKDNLKRDEYYSRLKDRINANWNLPEARRSELSGLETEISFEIERNGKIQNIRFHKKSGNSFYDGISFQALKKAEPLPPFPPEIQDESIKITMAFKFKKIQ